MNTSARIHGQLSRRNFISRTALCASAAAIGSRRMFSAFAADLGSLPIVVFSKVYQELKLGFEDAAAVTAEAGLSGVDCPVRPGGEVLPERVTDDLPRYVETLRRKNLGMPLITTAITSVGSPHTEEIVRTAKRLGVQYYRLGFIDRAADVAKQVREARAQFKDLAALNKEVGLGAIFQNHSPAGHTYLGGDLYEMEQIVADFDPAQIGVAFDIGHALIVHGDEWRPHFQKLKSQLRVAYVKDAVRTGRWVAFGEGELGKVGYFELLKELGYQAPVSMHIEYDWSEKGKTKDRQTLTKVLQNSSRVLKGWLAGA